MDQATSEIPVSAEFDKSYISMFFGNRKDVGARYIGNVIHG